MVDKETLCRAIEAIVRNGEIDKRSGEAAARTNARLLNSVEKGEGGSSELETAPRNVPDAGEALAQFRDVLRRGTHDELKNLMGTWTIADCYAI